ncbi:DNA primase [Streptomyces phage Kela]|nr:DNA primase [Streptomyces phage Kela]
MGKALEVMIAALDAAGSKRSRAGGGQVFQCPAHDDRSPSLSVSAGTKGMDVVFKCHAGCERDDILAALGLTWKDILGKGDSEEYRKRRADLWMPCQGGKDTPDSERCPGQKKAEYQYTDENGNLLYAVARCSHKGKGCRAPFAQWRPDSTRPYGKAWGLPGSVRRVLYNLPRVIEAAKAGRRIWIVEGEKDADRMKADFPDEVATTVVSGAGKSKWKLEYTRYFKGASEVIIFADCDKTGLDFAEEVYGHVSKVVDKVKVVCSPLMNDGADFSDHCDHGFGLDEFEIVPFEPIKKRPRMAIVVEEEHREKPVVFSGFSQESVERSLVGSILRYGNSYGINEVDLQTDKRLNVIVKASARLAASGLVITPEMVAAEIEDMGVSTYDKALPYALELEAAAFDDTAKPLIAARILRERTMRRSLAYVSRATESALQDERRSLEQILSDVSRTAERLNEEYASLEREYCQPVGDVFTGDVLEEIVMEEIEEPTNVKPIRQVVIPLKGKQAAQGG